MKRFFFSVVAWSLVQALAGAQPVDIAQPQSPPRPAPKWLKIVDQGSTDPRLKGYFTPEGIKVEIVADYPTVTNPVGMTFGADGTLYVLEWRPDPGGNFPEHMETFTYKDGTTRKVATMKKRVTDVVKVLRDTTIKGKYDEAKIILEDELPSSILIHDGWLYLSGRGTVRRYRLADFREGNKPKAEVIAQGFCGFHHHQVSGLTIGNDGWLYISSGDDDNFVEGSDGSRATALRTGAIFRCRPDGARMQVFATGFRNPYRDVAFDAAGKMFHVDNDNEDGSKFTGCRLMHIPEEADFGWRLASGARCCRPDQVRAAVYGELPGKMPPLLKTGRGAPAGLLIYNDTFFPEVYRGLLYYPDVFRKTIRAYRVEPRGASFTVAEEFELMKSDDPLFRPCQMVVGPDGAMYVCDWRTDSGGAGKLWGDGTHGRIYRLSWAGDGSELAIPLRGMDSWERIAQLKDMELVEALAAANATDRQRAQQEIVRRGPSFRSKLLTLLADPIKPALARIAALGALHAFWNDTVREAMMVRLRDADRDVRRLAADALAMHCKQGDTPVHEALVAVLNDDDPAVRRSLVLAIGKIADAAAGEVLVNVLKFDDGRDVYLTDGYVRAIERTGRDGIRHLLDLADSGFDAERNKVVEAYLGLRTRPAAEGIPKLLANPHLSIVQRAGLVRSYSNYLLDPPLSLEPLFEYLAIHAEEASQVKLAALEVLAASGALASARGQKYLLELLDDGDPTLRPGAIKAIEDTRLKRAAPRLLDLLESPRLPALERQAIVKALGVLNDSRSGPVLQALLHDPDASTALLVECLRSLTAVAPAAAQEGGRQFLDHKDPLLVAEAVKTLGLTPAGARLVGERFVAKKLPRELLPQVTEALRKHSGKEPELGKLLTEAMKGALLLSLEPTEVEKVRALVRSKGNAQRGKELYLNSKALACIRCHTLEGVGGNVGPDLTRLWDSHTLEKVMETLIEPSKEIKEGFQSYQAVTKKGQVFSGLKVAQNAAEVVLKDAEGREVRIRTEDLDELTPARQSLMPDNVIAQLSLDQFLDLVAFLKDRPAQESLRGQALEFWVVGPFVADLQAAEAPEKGPDPTATYAGAKWQPVQAEANGRLNLRTLFKDGPLAAYALTYVYSPQDQKATLLAGGGDLFRIGIDGRQALSQDKPGPLTPDSHRVEVDLKKGWNTVLIKVVRQENSLGLYLRFTGGEGLRVALKPEAVGLKP